MTEYEPTVPEARLSAYARAALSLGTLVGVVIGNTTGNWYPAFGIVGAGALCLAGLIAWAARTRNQGWMETARQIFRRKPRRRS